MTVCSLAHRRRGREGGSGCSGQAATVETSVDAAVTTVSPELNGESKEQNLQSSLGGDMMISLRYWLILARVWLDTRTQQAAPRTNQLKWCYFVNVCWVHFTSQSLLKFCPTDLIWPSECVFSFRDELETSQRKKKTSAEEKTTYLSVCTGRRDLWHGDQSSWAICDWLFLWLANKHTHARADTHTHLADTPCLSLQSPANYLNMEWVVDWDHCLNWFDTEITGRRTRRLVFTPSGDLLHPALLVWWLGRLLLGLWADVWLHLIEK